MKKFLFLFTFLLICHSGQVFAQSHRGQSSTNKEITAYPNPARDFLYLKTSDPTIKIKSVTFYSILGNVVADMPINASYSEIRVDKLKQGKYLMRYTLNDNTQKIIQIIKQ